MRCAPEQTSWKTRMAGGLVWLLALLALGALVAVLPPVRASALANAPDSPSPPPEGEAARLLPGDVSTPTLPVWVAELLQANVRPEAQGDLLLTKSARTEAGSSSVAFNGEYVTYTLVISNPGQVTATDIVLLDVLPEDTLDDIWCAADCHKVVETQDVQDPLGDTIVVSVTRQISWSLALLEPGAAVTKTFSGRVTGQTDGTQFSNRAFVSYEQDSVPKSGLSNDMKLIVRLPIEQTGSASFSSAPTWFSSDLGGALSLDWGDFDLDGDLDLALATSNGTAVYRNDGGRLKRFWGNDRLTYGVRWADLDNDGQPELVAVGDSVDRSPITGGKNYVYVAAATEFVEKQEFDSDLQLVRVAPGDFDLDGYVDLVLSTNSINAPCPVLLYRNTTDASAPFSDTGECISTDATAAIGPGDYDNDDDLDLILGLFPNQVRVFLNSSDGSPMTTTNPFTASAPLLVDESASFLPYDFAWGDYDRDGYLDLAAAYPLERMARIYHNQGGGGFEIAANLSTSSFRTPLALDWGDFDGDGCLDLAVADTPPTIYSGCNGSFAKIMALADDAVAGQVWSLRGVDQDGDADLDLSLSNRDGPSLAFTGFAPPLKPDLDSIAWSGSSATASVAWGDADGDGDLDLLFGAGQGAVSTKLYFNDSGTFPLGAAKPFLPTGFGPHSVAFGDVDNDGTLDVAVALGTSSGNQLYLAGHTDAADWTSEPAHIPSYSLAWADADDDGDLDLLVGNNGPNRLYLGQGTLLDSSPAWTYGTANTRSVAWADVDGDRFPDFAVGNAQGHNRLFHNNQDNTFSLVWTSAYVSNTTSVAWADYDRDGDPDLAVGNHGAANLLYENQGGVLTDSPVWRSAELSATTSLAWGDWDNDGDPDLAVGNDGQQDQVYANLSSRPGAPRLHWLWASAESQHTTGLAWGDHDGDGDLDLAVSQKLGGNNGVYENSYVSPSHLTDDFAPTMPLPHNPTYLAVERPGTADDAYFRSSAEILSGPNWPTVTIRYRLFDPDGTRDDSSPSDITGTQVISTVYEFSLDGGSTWLQATPAISSAVPPTTTSRLGQAQTFLWDAVADQAISDDARFRVRIIHDNPIGPVQRASTSAVSPPFRVRGTTCVWPKGPSIQVSNPNPPLGEAVRFEGGVVEGSGVLTFTWDFGDGTGDQGQVVYHTYTANNRYRVRLTVRSEPCPIAKEVVAILYVGSGSGAPNVYLPFITKAYTGSTTAELTTRQQAQGELEPRTQRLPRAATRAGRSPRSPAASGGPAPMAPAPLSAIPVTSGIGGISNRPSLNADGRFVAFWSTGNPASVGNNADGNIEVFVADLSNTQAIAFTQLTSSTGSILGGFNLDPSIDDGGTRTAFFSDRELSATGDNADANFELFLAETGSLTLTQLTTTTGGSTLSPAIGGDGAYLALVSDRDLDDGHNSDDNPEIFLLDRATGRFFQVTDTPPGVINDQPAINADGSRLAFVRSNEIWLAEVAASGTVTLTQLTSSGGDNRQPSINGDGKYVAFASDGDIVLAEIGAGGGITLTHVTSSTDVVDNEPDISADGSRLAFVSGGRIALYEVGSGEPPRTVQTEHARHPSLSADGTRIAFVSNRDIYLATAPRADLSITKQSEPPSMVPGDLVTYTIVARNAGPSDVISPTATVSDVLPNEINNVTWRCTASSGSSCAASGSGQVISEAVALRAGGVVTYVVTGKLDASVAADVVNTAAVTVPAGFTDWKMGNNQVTNTNSPSPEADLAVVKVVNDVHPNEGDVVTYTLTLHNNGLSDAPGVLLTDDLPAGLSYLSDAKTQGNYDSGNGEWTVGTLPAGVSATLTLTVQIDAGSGGMTITNQVDSLVADPPDPDPNNDTFSATLYVNAPPQANDDQANTLEGDPVAIDVVANDTDSDGVIDPGTVITLTSPISGDLSAPSPTGVITYTPQQDFDGSDSFDYQVCDDDGACDQALVTVVITPVNDAPIAANDSYTVTEDDILVVAAPGVLTNDSDVEHDPLTAVLIGNVSHGSLDLRLDGSFTYTPTQNYFGSDSFTYVANDGTADSGVATVDITVISVNDAPVFTKGADQTVPEDAGPQTVLNWATGILPGPLNESGQTLTFQMNNDNPALFSSQPTVSVPSGDLSFTPADDANGSATVTVRLHDDGGLDHGGQDTSPPQTFTITVTPVNDPPDAVNDTATVAEDSGANGIDVLANDTDAPDSGETLTIQSVTQGNHGAVVITGGGTGLTYEPAPDYFGPDSFTYTINDGHGGTDTANVNVTVTPVNDPPDAVDDTATVAEDSGANSIDVLANDTDAPDSGETLTIESVTQGSHGAVVITGGGTGLTYQPDPDYSGPDSFTYTINDGHGGTDTASVDVDVTPVNDPPKLDLNGSNDAGIDFSTSFAAGGGPVRIEDTDLDVSDADNSNLESAQVTITNLQDGASEVLTATAAGSIVVSYNSATGVLTLSGSDTVGRYRQVLRTVTYDNTAAAPSTTTRHITFVVNDGADDSATATTTLTVTTRADRQRRPGLCSARPPGPASSAGRLPASLDGATRLEFSRLAAAVC